MTALDSAIQFASRIWHLLHLHKTPLVQIVDKLLNIPLPVGLSYPYGTLYGWTLHEKLHNPEMETVAFFNKKIASGDSVADIGTNIGYYTLQFSNLVGNTGSVTSFEPSKGAFLCLKKAIRNKTNVTAINKGVFSRTDTLKLYSKRAGDPMGSMMYKRSTHYDEVPVIALREYPKKFTFAKIDVEGAEIEVLKGFGARIPAVLEVARGILETQQGGIRKFFSEIEALGYSIYFIQKDGATVPYVHDDISPLMNNIYIEPTT